MRVVQFGTFFCLVTTSAIAGDLACYEEPGTMKLHCISKTLATINGNLRASPLYAGGPRSIEKTPYTFVADCSKGLSTLQDRTGANFGGNFSNATPVARHLSQWLCELKNPKPDKRLRQF